MQLHRMLPRLAGSALMVVGMASIAAQPEPPKEQPTPTPWGVSSSASSFKDVTAWFPKMTEAGVTTVRLFPEWRGFEPKKGTWNWDHGDLLVKTVTENKLEINAILMGSPPGTKTAHAFPMDNLDDWSNFVEKVVGRYKKHVHYWEVWNEGNGSFNDGRHVTADYAKLPATTYAAAKKADPQAKVGLTVASFDVPYLNQTIRAMAKAGKPDSFDYLCIHPYEIADVLADPDGEIPFLWMSHLTREMLKDAAPARKDAEIWITEVSRRVEEKKPRSVTDEDAAKALAKIYVMALAQGIARTQWFEGRDPIGEDHGFGLLRRDGTPRASYKTLKKLTSLLGPTPKYVGWLALGRDHRAYGFVFEGKNGPILIAWTTAGSNAETISFANQVEATDLVRTVNGTFKANQPLEVNDRPVLVEGLPRDLVQLARGNASKNFPWGGDYSAARTVSLQLGSSEPGKGIFQTGGRRPTVTFPDGSTGILVQGDINHPVSFYVHPSFASFQTREYYFRVTVRRVSGGNVGMNLIYETADSQGRTPYANVGKWFGTTNDEGWQTYVWHVKDACLSKMWGYDFTVRPEQSVPFVIGKVEVSVEPLK